MDPRQSKKRMVAIIVACVVLAAIIIGVVWWLWPRASTTGTPASPVNTTIPPGGITNISFSQDVYQIALQRARSWQSDAALMTMTSGDAAGQLWTFIFVSQKAGGQAYEVAMNGQTIVSASEVSIAGSGAALPQNITTPDQALAAGHAVPGYAKVPIESVQLVYNGTAKQWYWAMKTASGFTITTKATQ